MKKDKEKLTIVLPHDAEARFTFTDHLMSTIFICGTSEAMVETRKLFQDTCMQYVNNDPDHRALGAWMKPKAQMTLTGEKIYAKKGTDYEQTPNVILSPQTTIILPS